MDISLTDNLENSKLELLKQSFEVGLRQADEGLFSEKSILDLI